MNYFRILLISLVLTCSLVPSLTAQTIDSTFTVALPPDFDFPVNQVVEAANIIPDIEQLNFDTTAAIQIEEVIFDGNLVNYVSESVIKDRLSCLQTDLPLSYHERVRVFIDYFAVKNRDFTLKILQRKNLYFPLFEKILAEYGLPDQLKYLSIIESALVPHARSHAGAVGLWQFMPYTGRLYGLRRNYYVDERMDPEKATRAACKYLKYLHELFGDWELAIAAYNCGPGNVRKALRRSGKPYKFSTEYNEDDKNMNTLIGGSSHFWDVYTRLPRETRSYLPQLVAMTYVMSYAEEHHLIQEKPSFPIPTEEIYVSQSVDFAKLSKELNVCFDDLKLMNPELRWGIVPADVKNYGFKIPTARLSQFLNNREAILAKSKYTGGRSLNYTDSNQKKGGSDGKYYHTVRRGETLGLIAQRNGVGLSKLRAWNGIYSNLIKPGQKLVIYGPGTQPKTKAIANKSASVAQNQSIIPSGKTYTVRSGDSLWLISQKFKGMTVDKLKRLNNLRSNNLKPGQKLKLG